MESIFTLTPKWNEEQLQVLNSAPNVIVRGFAGSGKTLLAIHIAINRAKEFNESVRIVVFTKSLSYCIDNYINSLEIDNRRIFVMFHKEMEIPRGKTDILIVDEFQNFTISDLKKFRSTANGVYLFGDDDQRIYEFQYNLKDQKTLLQANLLDDTGFPVLYITENKRTSKDLRLFSQFVFFENNKNEEINDELGWYYKKCLNERDQFLTNELRELSGCIITEFKNEEDEIFWLINQIKDMKEKGKNETIAVLVNSNKYVSDLHDLFQNDGIVHSYKENSKLNPNFFKANIFVLTYHSAQGIQFDHVFLPFSNRSINENSFGQRAYFSAITRAVKSLNISFSRINSLFYEFRLEDVLYRYGKFIRYQYLDKVRTDNDLKNNTNKQKSK